MEDEIPPGDLIEVDIDVVGSTPTDQNTQANESERDDETASIMAKAGTPRSEISTGRDNTESETGKEIENKEQEAENEEQTTGSREHSKLETLRRSRPVPSVKSAVPPLRRSKRLRRQRKLGGDFISGGEISRSEEKSEDAYHEIVKIHRGRHRDGELQYLVTWANGQKSWVSFNQLNRKAVEELEKQQIPVSGRPKIKQRQNFSAN